MFFNCIFFSVSLSAQYSLGLDKKHILRDSRKAERRDSAETHTPVETDSSLLVQCSGRYQFETEYYFGSDGVCNREVDRYYSCGGYLDPLQAVLKYDEYKWKIGNDGTFYSRFDKHICFTVANNPDGNPCMTISYSTINLTFAEYSKKFVKKK